MLARPNRSSLSICRSLSTYRQRSFGPDSSRSSCFKYARFDPSNPQSEGWLRFTNPIILASLTVFGSCALWISLPQKVIQNSSTSLGEERQIDRPQRSAEQLTKIMNNRSLPMRTRMPAYIEGLQKDIVQALEALDPSTSFHWDHWLREAGGSGTSCVLQDGSVFEKAGVNVSVVHGKLPPAAVRQMRARIDEDRFDWWDGTTELPFFACGLSLVVHPVNPMAPTVHLNYRYFEIDDPNEPEGLPKVSWFGGGTDLTPAYLFESDAIHFHRTLKNACDTHDKAYYPRFKEWCDDYFYLPHRGERRGVGGIFFDDLGGDMEKLFDFVQGLGNSFLPAYMPIIQQRQWMRYSDHQKRWQQLRRGRYVEFNLVHDRGTKFGLATPGARVESILMSLPLTSRWEYMPQIGTQAGSEEEKVLKVLKEPKKWV